MRIYVPGDIEYGDKAECRARVRAEQRQRGDGIV